MKTAIKFFAAVVVAGFMTTTAFAADKTPKAAKAAAAKSVIALNALSDDRGIRVSIEKADASKAYVVIYDKDQNMLMKDVLPKDVTDLQKGYLIDNLEYGDYTIEVKANNQVVTKNIHVYEEDGKKSFFFVQ